MWVKQIYETNGFGEVSNFFEDLCELKDVYQFFTPEQILVAKNNEAFFEIEKEGLNPLVRYEWRGKENTLTYAQNSYYRSGGHDNDPEYRYHSDVIRFVYYEEDPS